MSAPEKPPFSIDEIVKAETPLVRVILGPDGRPSGSHAGVVVHAKPSRVWEVVADVPSYSRRVPMIDRVTRKDDVVTMELKFKIALFSVGFKARMDATVDEGKSILLAYKDGEPKDIEIRFDLLPVPNDEKKTALYAYIGYDVLSLGWLTKWFLKHHPEIRFGIVPGSALALAQMLREAAEE